MSSLRVLCSQLLWDCKFINQVSVSACPFVTLSYFPLSYDEVEVINFEGLEGEAWTHHT